MAILASALAFGIQHIFFATTSAGMLIYFPAFTAWGAASGFIVHRQKRLFPVTVAHFVVNLVSTLPAVVFPILILSGVVIL